MSNDFAQAAQLLEDVRGDLESECDVCVEGRLDDHYAPALKMIKKQYERGKAEAAQYSKREKPDVEELHAHLDKALGKMRSKTKVLASASDRGLDTMSDKRLLDLLGQLGEGLASVSRLVGLISATGGMRKQ